ncbi:MAG: hypothetical protein ACI4DV_05060 [Lachnospiraceae bacterium]
MKEKKSVQNKKKNVGIMVGFLLIAVTGIVFLLFSSSGKDEGIVAQIESYQGYTRTVSEEEYEFYSYFVKRDLPEKLSVQELDAKISKYISEMNAVFFLGNKLGICEPYSFDLLKLRMEQENTERKRKLNEGEAIYGLEQFTLETYYQYVRDHLETEIVQYLVGHVDREINRQAKQYYLENQEMFSERTSVTYEVAMDGQKESITADRKELNFLGKSDMGLADFLETGEPGDVYQDIQNGLEREVIIREITESETDFETDKNLICAAYIREELFGKLIDTVAGNNPVEFELDR